MCVSNYSITLGGFMRIFTFVLVLILALTVGSMAQVGVQAGYLMSAFEDQDEAASAFELGANYGFPVADNFVAGPEFSILVSPFEFESEVLGTTYTSKFTQTIIGAFGKYIIDAKGFTPYVKAAVGYYMGKLEAEGGGGSGEEDFKGAIGFSVGGGVQSEMGLYGEFVYRIVSRELDVDNAESFGANNWGIIVGYSIPVN